MIAFLTGIGAFILGALGVAAALFVAVLVIAAIVWAFENEIPETLLILGLLGCALWGFYEASMWVGYKILAVIT